MTEPATIPARREAVQGEAPARAANAGADAYDEWFAGWLRRLAAEHAARRPDVAPFPVDDFDGCTAVPDTCRHCCAVHDMDYHYARSPADRLAADQRLRDCVWAMARGEREWWSKVTWGLRAQIIYAGVRTFGGYILRRRPGWGSEPPAPPPAA